MAGIIVATYYNRSKQAEEATAIPQTQNDDSNKWNDNKIVDYQQW